MLQDLNNIEMASKMLLGALQKASEINPIDYCYNALNVKLDPLPDHSDEFKLLKHYIYNTWQDRDASLEIKAIF